MFVKPKHTIKILVFFLAFVVLFLTLSKFRPAKPTPPSATPYTILLPIKLEGQPLELEASPQYSFSSTFNLPTPITQGYFVQSNLIPSQAAPKFGFTSASQELALGKKVDYLWTDNNKSLIISSDSGLLRAIFKQSSPLSSLPPPEYPVADTIVRNYIQSLQVVPADFNLKLVSYFYQTENMGGAGNVSSQQSANRILLTYQYTYQQTPIVLNSDRLVSIEAVVDSSKTIRQLSIVIPPAVSSTQSNINTVSATDALKLVQTEQGAVLSISSLEASEGDPSPSFHQVVINEAQSSLFYSSDNQMYLPGYLFYGQAPATNPQFPSYNLVIGLPTSATNH